MNAGRVGLLAVMLAGGLLAVSRVAGSRSSTRDGVDYEAVAQKVVTESAGIHEGDLVLVSGSVRDMELLEDIAVNVRKAGAWPLVAVFSDRMTRRMYDDVPAKYDAQSPELTLKLAEIVTAFINVDDNEDPTILAQVPPERVAARGKAFAPVGTLMQKRGVRTVSVGNGLYPTAANAELFGVPREELARIFWDGVNTDYSGLQAKGETVRKVLAAGKEAHLTNPNGTDLRMRIEGRPVFVSDGVISPEDVKRGGAATQVWLPAGEVFLTPVSGTAEGKLVVDRDFFQGKEIRKLALNFSAGKVTSMSAESGLEPLKALYDATGTGKDEFAYLDVGINPGIRLIPGSRLAAFMPSGMVTVGIGGNTWAGGENEVPFGTTNYLPGSTLEVDGKTIVENGVLKL